ncbi:hypothetical protein BC939DRAFT_488680 [Gamsiella multidivaricata]|uniref:uncharacterized protein n=1 Tax=Gamsiella multidivaricata TaxID=101098 RepID=UPI00221EEACC|nr:uncharacterized protein BC939DRAFT_488680 [Gamsiella multidivaricata]KAG0362926.1 hypothetical protein BGZ54_008427 [Gamsiella multidivaricata]KAI7832829.1 hypothetical protein BC939DRAFT_488680 [Gamsiella multidivaricata]
MKLTSILSLAVALCVVSSDAAAAPKHPAKSDPCSDLAAQALNATSSLSFKAVKGCYEAQAFNRDVAVKTLASLESLLGNFYAFTDIARSHTGSPFQSPRVDLLAGLKKIGAKKWKTDYDFQMAIYYLLASVNDGHLAYLSNCYRTARFTQPIALYAPVVNGKQSVRIFSADATQPGVPQSAIVDCEVKTIDGVPALKAVQDFVDRTSGIAKDPSIRLTDALASVFWSKDWSVSAGAFSKRWIVPEKETMEYTLQCGSSHTQKIKVPWTINPITSTIKFNSFNDTKSYWASQCLAAPKNNDQSSNRHPDHKSNLAPATILFQERGSTKVPTPRRDGLTDSGFITKATQVFASATSAFYTINKSDTCVLVIATESVPNKAEYTQFLKGVEILRDAGCKKLVFDFTNNGGGSIDFAYFINALFFPEAKPYFSQDLRSGAYVQGVAKLAIKEASVGNSLFDARGWVSSKTGELFTDASMFTKGVKYNRGGRTDTYTQRNFFGTGWTLLPLPQNRTLSWKAEDMAIITNGFCGSACTMVATRFNIVHKVKTYVIGGIHKRPMGYFSFPGGFVYQNDDIVEDIQSLNYTAKGGPSYLPSNSIASIAMGELYASDASTVPLEYDYKYFSAQVHLDQDPVLARHPDNVWVKIAGDFKH